MTREDLASFYYYQPALQRVSIVDVKVPKDLKVGYIMGAGDDIPTVLQQIGIDVTVIPAEKLASEDLTSYGTIVLGIRAYDTQKDVAANNKKLLDYVSAGGTLIVQYDAGVGDFNSGHFTPFPRDPEPGPGFRRRSSGRDSRSRRQRVPLSQSDYAARFRRLGAGARVVFHGLSGTVIQASACVSRPRRTAPEGRAAAGAYGKGTYIYTGYAFFRQLPAGVPGAIRLYVNLLGAGHESSH